MRPVSVEALALGVEELALPLALTNDPTLSVATLGSATLVGGRGGLFRLGADGLEPLHPDPVLALAALSRTEIVIASANGLFVWKGSGAPQASPLAEHLGGAKPTALATRSGELWIGTDHELFLFASNALSSFAEITNTKALATFDGASDVMIENAGGQFSGLRVQGSSYLLRSLAGEISASVLVPGSNGEIFGLVKGALEARVPLDTRASWRPVALSPDSTDHGATDIQAIAVDPVSGSLWIVEAGTLVRLDKDKALKAAAPPSLGPTQVIATTIDSALWLSDGITLRRFRPAMMPAPDPTPSEPITYTNNIAQFSKDNCERCHAPLKIAHPLNTYEAWRFDIDRIIVDLDFGRMPQDGAALVGGSVDLVREWQRQGLKL